MHLIRRLRQTLSSDPARLVFCVAGFVCLLPFGYLLAAILHITKPVRPVFAVPMCFAIVRMANWVVPKFWDWVRRSTDVRWFFLHYAADRAVGVSHVEAMISAGEYDNAAAEIDALLMEHGIDAAVCRVGLDLHLGRFGSRARGEALLRRMRNENPAQHEKMATQRLIDIYVERPETYAKALSELRRLVARFPGTPEAAGAARAIAQLTSAQTAEARLV